MEVGEVAAASAGDEDLFAGAIRVVEQGDAAAAFGGFDGAEEAGCAGSEDDGVVDHLLPCSKVPSDQGLGHRAWGADLLSDSSQNRLEWGTLAFPKSLEKQVLRLASLAQDDNLLQELG
jgi:hypothetical protein